MRLTLATWNINSVRLRIDLVARFLAEEAPDILCLQETKCRDSEFPAAALRELGYVHLATHGQKGYHGVAIAAKMPFQILAQHPFCEKGDARHVAVTISTGAGRSIALHNFYVPAGGDEPDPALNPKFAHKLAFLDAMTQWTKEGRIAARDSILVGDLNIAPLETDVWNHKALLSVVSHTPVEVGKLTLLQQAGPWIDVLREFVPPEERLYSWWSYRAKDWEKSDRGRRLDHIWVSGTLKPHLHRARVLRASRNWVRPSDHVPVIADFKF
ncbi:MAG: exodeoxyribonuclease III [Alphaproteobacteria bacterium]|nr:exodeoxyribonuclease III [Alphaproteobacteria bacterium]